jgi:hypothetical protein
MALLCPTCRTENRDAAKFCKGCGGKLVSLPPRSAEAAEALDDAWGATVVASLDDDLALPPSPPPPRASRPSALHTASIEPASERPASRSHRRRSAPPPRDRSVFWVAVAAATIVVATAGLYVYRDQRRAPMLAVVQEQAPGSPGSAGSSLAIAVAPKSPALPITGAVTPEATAPAAPAQAVSPPAAVASTAVAARKPRKVASAPAAPVAPPPVAAAPVAPVVTAPEPVEPPPPADPGQACAGRGLIATSQCLVAQCAKPEFSAHARCDAVRKQQRIDEEKRNPTNAA